MSIINRVTRLRKHFVLAYWIGLTGCGNGKPAYKFPISSQNHCGLTNIMNNPIRQAGEIGPKPIIKKQLKTARHLICVRFIRLDWRALWLILGQYFAKW